MESLLTCKEAAALLKVHPDTVRAYVRRGELPVVKLGYARRIRPEDLEAFVASRVQGGPIPATLPTPAAPPPKVWEIARRGPNGKATWEVGELKPRGRRSRPR
jgi:excisionase family DNA binding protein